MPVTRNQRNSHTSSPNPLDQTANAESSSEDAAKTANTSTSGASDVRPDDRKTRSPSPRAPRLRDRRSLTTIKPFGDTVPSDYILHRPAPQKRPASTTPPSKKDPKVQPKTSATPPSRPSDKTKPSPSSSQAKPLHHIEGLSLLQKSIKPKPAQPIKPADTIQTKQTAQPAQLVRPAQPAQLARPAQPARPVQPAQLLQSTRSESQAEPKRHDYTRIRPPSAQVEPKNIEGLLQNAIRAKLLSNTPDNQRIDLSNRLSLPSQSATIRQPMRITLPPSPSKSYDLTRRSESPRSSSGETRQIEVINLNSSLLRRHQPASSGQSIASKDGAINLTTSSHSSPDKSQAPIDKIFNVLIAVTGSVAAVKLLELVGSIKSKFPKTFVSKADGKEYKASVRMQIILTENAKHFLPSKLKIFELLRDLTIKIHDDADEWSQWKKMGDPVLHIELRKWADIMVIAPLDANTLAKLATGICDNLLTCVARAWDQSKKLLFCPAMNVHMYDHPLTREQMNKLQSFGYMKVDSIEKRLACGDVGMGAMASVDTIAEKILENLLKPVSRSNYIDCNILTRQPTYPIMPTRVDTSSSLQRQSTGVGKNLPSKSLGSAQSSMHEYINVRASQSFSAGRVDIRKTSTPSTNNMGSTKSLNGVAHTSGSVVITHRAHPNLVTSLQNLQAINGGANASSARTNDLVGNGTEGILDDKDDDIIDQATPEDCNSEYSYNGFDPTDLLEQSLVTGESFVTSKGFPQNDTNAFHSTNSTVASKNFVTSKKMERGPVYNTTKVLDSCYDQSRDCYVCSICRCDYKNRKSIARHLKEQHLQGNIYNCVECGLSYKRREKLIKHNKQHHDYDGI